MVKTGKKLKNTLVQELGHKLDHTLKSSSIDLKDNLKTVQVKITIKF